MRRLSTAVVGPGQYTLFEEVGPVEPTALTPMPLSADHGRDEGLYELAMHRADLTGESAFEAYAQVEAGNEDPYETANTMTTDSGWIAEAADAEGAEGTFVWLSDRAVCIRETYLALRALGRASRNSALGMEHVEEIVVNRQGEQRGEEIVVNGLAKVRSYHTQARQAVVRSFGANELNEPRQTQAVVDFMDQYVGPANAEKRKRYYEELRRLARRSDITLSEPK